MNSETILDFIKKYRDEILIAYTIFWTVFCVLIGEELNAHPLIVMGVVFLGVFTYYSALKRVTETL